MRRAAALVLATTTGCSFQVKTDGAPAGETDAASDIALDTRIDGTIGAPFCDPTDPQLVGCWELEGVATDASSYANHATASAVTYGPGRVGQAIDLTTSSYILVPDSATMDVTSLTIEAWVRADNLNPASGRSGIVDNDGQYGLFMLNNGDLWCNIQAPFNITIVGAFISGRWTHVACTYANSSLTVYVDGTPRQTINNGPPMNTGATGATALGANRPSGDLLEGSLDQVRIWARARTPQEICTAAGGQC